MNKNTHEVVKYHNTLNAVPFGALTGRELNIFFAILSKLKTNEDDQDKLTEEVSFSFKELRKLTGCEAVTSNKIFAEIIIDTNNSLLKATPTFIRNDGTVVQFSLFNKFETNPEQGTLKVSVNDNFTYILSATTQFTRFELNELVQIKHLYSKVAYVHLKQWRHVGSWSISVEDFRKLFAIPSTFRESNITTRILNPIIEDLSPYFKNLCFNKVRGSGKGRPVIKYHFMFDTETKYKKQLAETDFETFKSIDAPTSQRTHTCPICGGILIEREMNGVLVWCHIDGWKENAKCKAVFNTIAEIKGYKEK